MSIARWQKKLGKLDLELHVLERGVDPVEWWRVFVSPRGLPDEPLYRPPIGVGANVERELAIREAVADCAAKLVELAPEARAYFSRSAPACLPVRALAGAKEALGQRTAPCPTGECGGHRAAHNAAVRRGLRSGLGPPGCKGRQAPAG
jgi:hypothetical protein